MNMGQSFLAAAMGSALALGAGAASADTVMLSAFHQGWINQTGFNSAANLNTLVGNCGASDCVTGEYRDFFDFVLPMLTGTVTSATLFFPEALSLREQSPSLDYQVTSTPAFNFASLGNGTFYGAATRTDGGGFSLNLSSAALTDLFAARGGAFEFSGRAISPISFGASQPDQFILAGTAPIQLRITTGSPLAAPEPAAWSLMILGFGAVGVALRRRRATSSLGA